MNLRETIIFLNKKVTDNQYHHLEQEERYQIKKQLTAASRNRLLLLTLIKIYPFWEMYWPSNRKFLEIFEICSNYHASPDSKVNLQIEYNKYVPKIENLLSEGKFEGFYAGFAACQTILEIDNFEIFSNVGKEEESEPHYWDSAFYASLAFSNGPYWDDKSNINNRLNFWLWYLNDAISYATSAEPIPTIEKNKVIISPTVKIQQARHQTFLIDNNVKIKDIFDKICKQVKSISKLIENDYIEMFFLCIHEACSVKGKRILNNQEHEIPSIDIYTMTNGALNKLIFSLKESMFAEAPNEGAWYSAKLKYSKNDAPMISFNFDDNKPLIGRLYEEFRIVNDFKKFPRDPKFIPEWLKIILDEHS